MQKTKLDELCIDAQMLVISLIRLQATAEAMSIAPNVLGMLKDATKQMKIFRRELAAERLVERGILCDTGEKS